MNALIYAKNTRHVTASRAIAAAGALLVNVVIVVALMSMFTLNSSGAFLS